MTIKKDPPESKIKPFKRRSALDKQIGGTHYKSKSVGGIDPIQLIVAHNLDFIDGNIVKYAVEKKIMRAIEKDTRKLNTIASWHWS